MDPVQNALADMTSTFGFTASARVNGTLVQCRESTATGIQMENSTFIATGTTTFVGEHAVSCFIVTPLVANHDVHSCHCHEIVIPISEYSSAADKSTC